MKRGSAYMDILETTIETTEEIVENTILLEIIDDKSITWDQTKVVKLATDVICDYGVVIKETSKMMFGAPESLLPYQKKYIREAIVILLHFLKDKNSWDDFREECPEIADSILTNKYYNALRSAYVKLARFIPDSEAELAIKASQLFNNSKSEEMDSIRGDLSSSWYKKARDLQRKVNDESTSLMEEIEGKYGKKIFNS
ncbi:hypothetical protein ACFL2X_06625 [Candidatus Latescibacterota bacterium]